MFCFVRYDSPTERCGNDVRDRPKVRKGRSFSLFHSHSQNTADGSALAPSIAVSLTWEFVWGNTMTTPLIDYKILLMVSIAT